MAVPITRTGSKSGETFVKTDPLGNPVDKRHPWNQTTTPKPQKRDFKGNYTWVMSPRWFDKRTGDHLALDTGGGPLPRLWATALNGLVDIGYIKATGHSVKINLPKTALLPETEFEWKIPKWSNAIERDRARTYFQAYAAAAALYFVEKALDCVRKRQTRKPGRSSRFPKKAIGCGFHEAVRGVLSHHVVIRDRKIANYHPYPPTPWNASPRDSYGTPGPYEDAIQNTPIFEENGPENFKGIDIMRAVRSFDPVPAVRRAHVSRQRKGSADAAFIHVRHALGADSGCCKCRETSCHTRKNRRSRRTRKAPAGERRCCKQRAGTGPRNRHAYCAGLNQHQSEIERDPIDPRMPHMPPAIIPTHGQG